jgi:hypothetical protein
MASQFAGQFRTHPNGAFPDFGVLRANRRLLSFWFRKTRSIQLPECNLSGLAAPEHSNLMNAPIQDGF